MYFILIIILLILFSWLVRFALRSTTKGIKLLLSLSGISVLAISILIIISYHYKEINSLALILILILGFALVMFYYSRRLR